MNCFLKIAIFILLFSPTLQGEEVSKKCFEEVERNFFQTESILLTFSYYQRESRQGQWNLAVRQLGSENSSIPRLIKARAKKMRPNPLQHPFDSQGAVNLLREVTKDIFFDVMQKTQAAPENTWEMMFQYLFDYEMGRLKACESA